MTVGDLREWLLDLNHDVEVRFVERKAGTGCDYALVAKEHYKSGTRVHTSACEVEAVTIVLEQPSST